MRTLIGKPFVLLCVALAFAMSGYFLWAAQPDWWTDYSLINEKPRQDDCVATIGQAKHVVRKAYQYLEAELASVGGAGAEVAALYNNYCTKAPDDPGNDLQVLTIGQLKHLAKSFYDRLNSAEVAFDTSTMNPASTDIYPWTVDQFDDDDLALATLGQLKFAFSFDLSGWSPPMPNEPPVVTSVITDIVVDEDAPDSTIDLYAAFEDSATDDEDLVITITNSNSSLVAVPPVEDVLTLSYAANASGAATITVTATDDDATDPLSTSQSFKITVNAVNDAPVIDNQHLTSIVQNNLYSYKITATDPDINDTVSLAVPVLPDWLRFNGSTLSGAPGYEDVGFHTVVITASDLLGATAEESFVINVSSANGRPYFLSKAIVTADVDSLYNYSVIASDPDPDDSITLSLTKSPGWLSFDGVTLSGTPDIDDVGKHLVDIKAIDSEGAIQFQSFIITVDGSPKITSNPVVFVNEGATYSYTITATDPDPDDSVTISVPELPDWLSFDGATLSGTPSYEDVRGYNLEVIATDSNGATDTQEFTITVALLDTDSDSLSDNWEMEWFTDLDEGGANFDYDSDGIDNLNEFQKGLNPTLNDSMQDSDGDGYPNVYEALVAGGDLNDPSIFPQSTFTVSPNGVDADYSNLQDAIDAVTADYSILLVKPGDYLGTRNAEFRIEFDDPPILLISEGGAALTSISGESTLTGGQVYNSRSGLVGFSIHDCVLDDFDGEGAGLFIQGDEIFVADCEIYNNRIVNGSGAGGGLFIHGADSVIKNCKIYQNEAAYGGGVYTQYAVGLIIDESLFYENHSTSLGGALYLRTFDVAIKGCEFYENSSDYGGGALCVFDAHTINISNTLIYNNTAVEGGGILVDYPDYGTLLTLTHVTLTNNDAPDGSEIYNYQEYSYRDNNELSQGVVLNNSIVWNALSNAGLIAGEAVIAGNSIVKSNSGYLNDGGVIQTDPQLRTDGLLTKASQAAFDSGSDAGVTNDIHKEARPLASGFDMGADEWLDTDSDGLPDWWEILYGFDPNSDTLDEATADNDGDSLNNLQEYFYATDPILSDSDTIDSDPSGLLDSDDDGISDADEINIYDTNPLIADSDGDGLDDGEELSSGSDPNDYYNGDIPTINLLEGNDQFGFTDAIFETGLKVSIVDSGGSPLTNAPVTFQVRENGNLLRDADSSLPRYDELTLRTDAQGLIGYGPSNSVFYESGSRSGLETVEVTAGDATVRMFNLTVIETGTTGKPIDLRKRDNADGTVTLSWSGTMMDTSELVIRRLKADGSWQVIHQFTDSEADWPAMNSMTNRYEITLDLNDNSSPEQTEETDALQIGKRTPGGNSYTYSDVAGFPTPEYSIIPVESDAGIKAVANNGWILLEGRVRWKFGVAEQLELPAGGAPDFAAVDMNNAGYVIGHGEAMPNDYYSMTPIVWKPESSVGSYLTGLPAASVHTQHIDDKGNFYGEYFRSNEITPPRTYPCTIYGNDGTISVITCQFYQSFFAESFDYSSNINNDVYADLAYSSQFSNKQTLYTLLLGTPRGEFIDFSDTYYDQENEVLDYIFIKRPEWGYYEEQTRTALSNFAPANLNMIPHNIGKNRLVVGTTEVRGGEYCLWRDGSLTLLGEASEGGTPRTMFIAHPNNEEELIIAGKEMWLNIADSEGMPTGNYLRLSLDQLVDPDSGWTDLDAHAVSDNGYIAGRGLFHGEPKSFLLLKMDIAVDNNRDGEIEFGKSDQTTDDQPYRFWLNSDSDRTELGESPDGTSDSGDNVISTKRDLEDFTRLSLIVDSIQEQLKDGTIELGFKWKDVQGSPSLKLYLSAISDGSKLYVEDASEAALQLDANYRAALGTVSGSSTTYIDKTVFENIDPEGKVHFLFEGVSEGKSQLVMILKIGDAESEGPSEWIELLPVEKMYQTANATPIKGFSSPAQNSEAAPSYPSFGYSLESGFEAAWDEEQNSTVFIHGWRMTADESRLFAETMFKRLWWEGYKGRYTYFRWPTLTADYSFSESELRAWKYGESLKSFLDAGAAVGYRKNVMAHSLGNVVVAGAIKRGASMDTYIAMQAAIPAGCYDVSSSDSFFDNKTTPDLSNPDKGYRGYLANSNVNVINYYNPNDYALVRGTTWVFNTNWREWQRDHKPRLASLGTAWDGYLRYIYDPAEPSLAQRIYLFRDRPPAAFDDEILRYIIDLEESMSMVATSKSSALGATTISQNDRNLSDSAFGSFTRDASDHSGQFNRPIQAAFDFYSNLIVDIDG